MSLNCDNGPLARPTIKHIPQLKSTSYYILATLETLFIKRSLFIITNNIIVNPLEIKTCYLIGCMCSHFKRDSLAFLAALLS